MRISWRSYPGMIILSFSLLSLSGCLGWLDIFAERHPLSGDYYLMHGEGSPDNGLFLMEKGRSGSLTGDLHKIGWSQTCILFTDDNWPTPWSVIDVQTHHVLKITERQRLADDRFKSINVLSPTDAWITTKPHR